MKLPLIISLPHCSGKVPERIRSRIRLSDEEIGDAVDLGTREIFGELPAKKVLYATWSRLVVDLNRPPDQRDAKGPVALMDYHGRPIYGPNHVPGEPEIIRRLRTYHEPYHRQLADAVGMENIKGLLDCHSLQETGPREAPDAGRKRKDITLGNNGGPDGEKDDARGDPTCGTAFLNYAKQAFESAGFSVSLNNPYAGGFIVSHYGPALCAMGKFALQVEINQGLYLDPQKETLILKKAQKIRARIHKCLQKICEAA